MTKVNDKKKGGGGGGCKKIKRREMSFFGDAINFYFSDGSNDDRKNSNFLCAYCSISKRSMLQPCSANKENL
jgi:hypothetical protein